MKDSTIALVVVGHFNSAILQPDWIIQRDIVPEPDDPAERKGLTGLPTTPFFGQFELGGIKWDVAMNRLVLETPYDGLDGTAMDRVSNAATSLFSLLPHTPVSAVGVNLHGEISGDEWAGGSIDPQQRLTAAAAEHGEVVSHEHKLSVTLPGGDDEAAGVRNVQVRHSTAENAPYRVTLNHHYNVSGADAVPRVLDRAKQDVESATQLITSLTTAGDAQ